MIVLEIQATSSTPAAHFNYEKGELHISGRSLNNNVDFFFKPLIKWVDEYITKPRENTTVYLHLEYLNTSSVNYVFTLLKKLKLLTDSGTSIVTINWKYDIQDEDMLRNGQLYSEMLKMPFVFIKDEEA
jgi:hypothetical protein